MSMKQQVFYLDYLIQVTIRKNDEFETRESNKMETSIKKKIDVKS